MRCQTGPDPPHALGRSDGLSLRLTESHYENHYRGAPRKLNAITDSWNRSDFETLLVL